VQLLTILALGVVSRVLFTGAGSTDQWQSLWCIKRQEGSRWVNYRVADSLLPGEYQYPVFHFWLVSRFPRAWQVPLGFAFSIASDVLVGLGVFALAHVLLGRVGVASGTSWLTLPDLACALYLTSPILCPVEVRIRAIKGRPIGGLFAAAHFFGLGVGLVDGAWWGWAMALVFAWLCIMTSFFALQAVLFFGAVMSVLRLSVAPLTPVAGAMLLGWFLPFLGARQPLALKWHHAWCYRMVRQRGLATTAEVHDKWSDLARLPLYLFTDPRRFLQVCLVHSSYIISLYSAPAMYLLFYALARDSGTRAWVSGCAELRFLLDVSLAGFACFLLTSLRPLNFLGEAQRYLEYSAPAFCILAVLAAGKTGVVSPTFLTWLVPFQVLATVGVAAYANVGYSGAAAKTEGQDEKDALGFLSAEPGDLRVAVVPTKRSYLFSAMDPDGRLHGKVWYYYHNMSIPGDRWLSRFFLEDYEPKVNHVFRDSPEAVAAKYALTHFVLERRLLQSQGRLAFIAALIAVTPAYSNGTYHVYRVGPTASGASAPA
jgi:hypothetical protein